MESFESLSHQNLIGNYGRLLQDIRYEYAN